MENSAEINLLYANLIATKEWISQNNVPVFGWSPLSTYLNWLQNAWGILIREVCKNGKQLLNQRVPSSHPEIVAFFLNESISKTVASMTNYVFLFIPKQYKPINV